MPDCLPLVVPARFAIQQFAAIIILGVLPTIEGAIVHTPVLAMVIRKKAASCINHCRGGDDRE